MQLKGGVPGIILIPQATTKSSNRFTHIDHSVPTLLVSVTRASKEGNGGEHALVHLARQVSFVGCVGVHSTSLQGDPYAVLAHFLGHL